MTNCGKHSCQVHDCVFDLSPSSPTLGRGEKNLIFCGFSCNFLISHIHSAACADLIELVSGDLISICANLCYPPAVFEYCSAGDLYTCWLLKGQFDQDQVRLLAAELGSALGIYVCVWVCL